MYKRFLIKLTLIFILVTILYSLLIYTLYKRPISTNWIYNAYKIKEQYAKNITKPKIIFTGGSNVLMGISTSVVQKKLNIPSVNYGVHAGLRTSYIIYKTKQILKSGDTVIMPLEYSNINWDGSVNDTLVGYILTKDKKYFDSLDIITQLKMLYSITPYKFFKMYLSQVPSIKRKLLQQGYRVSTININGDETANIGAKYNHKFAHIKLPKKDLLQLKGMQEIISFDKWCKEHNVKFYLTYPNILRIKEANTDKFKDYILMLEKIMADNNVSLISKPSKAFYKQYQMYDSKYHLNKEGNLLRTYFIIKLLKRKLLK